VVASNGEGGGGSETGWVAGGGIEYMISGNVSAGIEGLYYSFDDNADLTVLRARLTFHLDRSPHQSFKDGYDPPVLTSWSGFYAGINAGVGFGSGKRVATLDRAGGDGGDGGEPGALGRTDINPGTGFPRTDGIDDPGGGGGGGGGGGAAVVGLEDDDGILGGVHLGYNWQKGAYVFGVEGDADIADEDFRDYLASARVRLGYSFDRVLLYGTAGVAFAKTAGSVASLLTTPGGPGGDGADGKHENVAGFGGGVGGAGGLGGGTITTTSEGDDKVGFVVGGGFEVKLSQSTSLGLEGLYYGFDGGDGSSSGDFFEADDDASVAVVRGRVTFHLDGGGRDPLK
jgi:opacity protein-like surface antigen